MLVLTRKVDEKVIIGDDIEVMIVGMEGDQVKLGIDAPKSIPIHRQEVYEEIQRENIEAAQASGEDLESVSELIQTSDDNSTDDVDD